MPSDMHPQRQIQFGQSRSAARFGSRVAIRLIVGGMESVPSDLIPSVLGLITFGPDYDD